MGSAINFYLLTLVNAKHRRIVKVFYYLSTIMFYVLIFANTIRIFSGAREFIGVFFIVSLAIVAVSFLAYKLSYIIFRKIQKTDGDEILQKYSAVFDKHMKKSNVCLIISLACMAVMAVFIIIGVLTEETNLPVSIVCAIFAILSMLGFIIVACRGMFNGIAFGKKAEHKEIIQLRRTQILNSNDEKLKAVASGAVSIYKLEDYIYPDENIKKKLKKTTNLFGIALVVIMFLMFIPMITALILAQSPDVLFRVLVISFSSFIILMFLATIVLRKRSTKIMNETKDFMKMRGDRYLANIEYLGCLKENEKTQRVPLIILIVGMNLSGVLGIISGILGLNNALAPIFLISGVVLLLSSFAFSICSSLILASKTKGRTQACQLKIDEQERLYELKQKQIQEQEQLQELEIKEQNIQEQSEINE